MALEYLDLAKAERLMAERFNAAAEATTQQDVTDTQFVDALIQSLTKQIRTEEE